MVYLQSQSIDGVNLTVSFQMSVEVERKFLCNADTLKTLEEISGTCSFCLPHIYAWVNLELKHLADAVIHTDLQMVTEMLFKHLMTLIELTNCNCSDTGHLSLVNNEA